MFCPKCGKAMKEDGGTLTCVEGQMTLAPDLANRFKECFELKQSQPQVRPVKFKNNNQFFCPGCGVAEKAENGSVLCPQCGLALDEFLFQLNEMHPHAK